jgi:hypothetical protein
MGAGAVELKSFVSPIAGFAKWSHADKIRFFAWFLHTHQRLDVFKPSDISKCYDALSLDPPSSVSPFLAAMGKKSPREVIRKGTTYCLDHRVRRRFDEKYGRRDATVKVDSLLSGLPERLPVLTERAYLDEALCCFRHAAFRAAIVMAWNLAYDHLCNFVLSRHLVEFNDQLPKSYPRAEIGRIDKRDDFAELKESQVLQVCRSALIVSGSLHKVLKEKLDRRNIAAHPCGIETTQLTAEEFIRDLVDNVVLKLE